MAKNRLSQIRKSRALTQRGLAELAGTSQQQVQRIEAGVQGVRLELATKIAVALKCELAEIFPSLVAHQARKKAHPNQRVSEEKFLEAGLDPDPVLWTIKLFAHDGRVFLYRIASDEKSRLERLLSAGENEFLVFTTDSHRIALNPKKIAATQFLFDIGAELTSEGQEKYELSLHLIAARDPIIFGIDPDQRSLDDEDDGASAQFQSLFFYLDLGVEDEVLWFDDEDGERVYLKPSEILVMEVPLSCCEPALQKAKFDGYLEDET